MDRPDLVSAFQAEASLAGISADRQDASGRTRFAFELEADSPADACELVTALFRSVYGMNWWADVTATCRDATARPKVRTTISK